MCWGVPIKRLRGERENVASLSFAISISSFIGSEADLHGFRLNTRRIMILNDHDILWSVTAGILVGAVVSLELDTCRWKIGNFRFSGIVAYLVYVNVWNWTISH